MEDNNTDVRLAAKVKDRYVTTSEGIVDLTEEKSQLEINSETKTNVEVLLNNVATLLDLVQVIKDKIDLQYLEPSDVNFWDYDGSLVASYTALEFNNLELMPTLPMHRGLTAQNWNWNLNTAKSFVALYGKCEIGANYITDNGDTRIYVTLTDGLLLPTMKLYLNGNVVINWGDGNINNVEGSDITVDVDILHTYQDKGDYVITITPTSTTEFKFSSDEEYSQVLYDETIGGSGGYNTVIRKVELGYGITVLGDAAFYGCINMESISIPDGFLAFAEEIFYYNTSLKALVIPISTIEILKSILAESGVVTVCFPQSECSINLAYAFDDCYFLKYITLPHPGNNDDINGFNFCYRLSSILIPQGTLIILRGAFEDCYGLTAIDIPESITDIEREAFSNCHNLHKVIVRSITPPTLAISPYSAFYSTPSNMIIQVPAESVDAYKEASGWSTYASQIESIPED